MAESYFFNNGDIIKVDKVYYETPNYYSLTEKTFSDKQSNVFTKVELKEKETFFTRDADIASFKLTSQGKNR